MTDSIWLSMYRQLNEESDRDVFEDTCSVDGCSAMMIHDLETGCKVYNNCTDMHHCPWCNKHYCNQHVDNLESMDGSLICKDRN